MTLAQWIARMTTPQSPTPPAPPQVPESWAGMFNASNPDDPYPLRPETWDTRPDGTKKGNGFLGPMIRPDGTAVMSEYSAADSEDPRLHNASQIGPDGTYLSYPTIVPTLTEQEVKTILSARKGEPLPPSILRKAESFALKRIESGKSVYAQPGEENMTLYPSIRRAGQKP